MLTYVSQPNRGADCIISIINEVMKRIGLTMAACAAALGIAVSSLTACDAMWDTSMDLSPGYSGYYGVGFDEGWLPSGGLWGSPVYWGGGYYPGGVLPPVRPPYRPSYRPNPSPPIINGGIGNVRPGSGSVPSQPSVPERPSQPSTPSTPSTPSVPSGGNVRPGNLNGSNPGIALPPPGTGYRPGRH